MSRRLLVGIALVVLVLAGAAGFAAARSRYLAAESPASGPALEMPAREAEPAYGRPGHRKALQGTVISWQGTRLVLRSENVTYTVVISPRTKVVRRTSDPVGAKAVVLGRTQDSTVTASMVMLLPYQARPGP